MTKAKIYWLTGLSGSGKSTIGEAVALKLQKEGYFVKLLDGDVVRRGLCKDLGFSPENRRENIRRVAELSKILSESGIACINCFISPTREIRALAREIIGREYFVEIFIKASLAACESRDVKGLYKKARAGIIPDFTGINSPFEHPENPDLIIDTEISDIIEAVDKLYNFIT